MQAQIDRLATFKAARSADAVTKATDAMVRAAHDDKENVFGAIVDAAGAGVTHGEICALLRRELGFGQPLVVA
jgi:methylmalonyl-CoA mutase N-terminal domain/subunit